MFIIYYFEHGEGDNEVMLYAANYFHVRIDGDDADSLYIFCLMAQQGNNFDHDIEMALKYLKMSADHETSEAQYNIADMF